MKFYTCFTKKQKLICPKQDWLGFLINALNSNGYELLSSDCLHWMTWVPIWWIKRLYTGQAAWRWIIEAGIFIIIRFNLLKIIAYWLTCLAEFVVGSDSVDIIGWTSCDNALPANIVANYSRLSWHRQTCFIRNREVMKMAWRGFTAQVGNDVGAGNPVFTFLI